MRVRSTRARPTASTPLLSIPASDSVRQQTGPYQPTHSLNENSSLEKVLYNGKEGGSWLVSIDRSFNPLHFRTLNLKNCFERLKNFSKGELESKGVHGKKIIPVLSLYNSSFLGISGMPHFAIIIIHTIHESWPSPLPLYSTFKRLFAKSYSNKQVREFSLVFPRNLEFMKIVFNFLGTVSWTCCNGWPSFSIKI